ncbi:stage II sporulation protein M [Janibacter sp. GXQ6167]|uniref:stage II sporulation protein M n=1 Tax=Janibacter sp. GXQ6167 TaxID=3240791 RepID=UPI00352549D5
MDLDAFIAVNAPHWRRLDHLVRQRRLSAAEADELLDLYQRVSTHLSVVRTASPDPSIVSYLSSLLARARVHAAVSPPGSWAAVGGFFTHQLPGTLYRMRRWWIAVSLACLALIVLATLWTLQHPEVYTSQLTPAEIDAYVNTDFENYYSEYAHHEFATLVWVNNAWIAAQCIGAGVLGLPVLYVLYQNCVAVGAAAALMIDHGRADLFFGLILPHGLLELTAVFIAGAVGLRLFWSWVEPGPRTRLQSLAAEARASMVVALGLVVVLLISGVIEGFVTPSSLPTWSRIGIGIVAEVLFLTYVFVLGRRAVSEGVTGDLGERDRGALDPITG